VVLKITKAKLSSVQLKESRTLFGKLLIAEDLVASFLFTVGGAIEDANRAALAVQFSASSSFLWGTNVIVWFLILLLVLPSVFRQTGLLAVIPHLENVIPASHSVRTKSTGIRST
jgi:hypothetical protein